MSVFLGYSLKHEGNKRLKFSVNQGQHAEITFLGCYQIDNLTP
jgi:hypothetical protein